MSDGIKKIEIIMAEDDPYDHHVIVDGKDVSELVTVYEVHFAAGDSYPTAVLHTVSRFAADLYAKLEIKIDRLGHGEKERAETLMLLRELCGDFGDNDWPDNLHLVDIIEKHLIRPLVNRLQEAEDRPGLSDE